MYIVKDRSVSTKNDGDENKNNEKIVRNGTYRSQSLEGIFFDVALPYNHRTCSRTSLDLTEHTGVSQSHESSINPHLPTDIAISIILKCTRT